MTDTKKRDTITALFVGFSGQDNTLVIPRPYIEFCGGDHLTALLLSQILYWAERTDDPDGWFAKSYTDWEKELCMTEYQVKRAISGDKRRKKIGFILENIGIETKLERSKYYKGAATLHYKVDYAKLTRAIQKHFAGSEVGDIAEQTLQPPNNVQIDPPTSLGGTPQHRSDRSTETISETTTEIIKIPPSGGTVVNPDDKQPHVAIIEDGYLAAMEAVGRKVIVPKPIPRNATMAMAIHANNFTWQQVRDCVRWIYDPEGDGETQTYWQKRDDPISLERIAAVIDKWWNEHKPIEPVNFGTLAEWESERDAQARSPKAIAARNAVLQEAGYAIPDDN